MIKKVFQYQLLDTFQKSIGMYKVVYGYSIRYWKSLQIVLIHPFISSLKLNCIFI